jgi:hypothetical protein
MALFNKEYNKGEIIKCECGNEIFLCIKDTKFGDYGWANNFKCINGHEFKVGDVYCRCNKCGIILEWFEYKYEFYGYYEIVLNFFSWKKEEDSK